MNPRIVVAACLVAAGCVPVKKSTLPDPSRVAASVNAAPGTARISHVASHPWGNLRVDEYRLTNGLKILVVEDHSAPVFAYQTWFDVGSVNERLGITGIAHLFEHLMFKGTDSVPGGEFSTLIERLGGRMNATTWYDWTYYREDLPAGHLDTIARVEADRMRNLVIDAEQLGSERGVVINERKLRIDDDAMGTIYETLYELAFKVHPYRWPPNGRMRDLETITLEDAKAFYRTYYAPNNATVIVVGDVDSVETLTSVRTHYGPLESQSIPEETFGDEPEQGGERRQELELTLGVEKLVIGYRQPSLRTADHAAIEILNAILLEGGSSRIHRRLVARDAIASEVSGWVCPWKYSGLYEIVVSMQPGVSANKAEPALYEELERIARDGVEAAEVEGAKTRLEVRFLQDIKTSRRKAYQLGHYQTTTGKFEDVLGRVDQFQKVTAADVQRVAASLFDANSRNVIIARPKKKAEADKKEASR